ncbi:MAG: disulfide bond formation protein B [Oceanicaulis sp.]
MKRPSALASAALRPDRWPLLAALGSGLLLAGAFAFEIFGNYPPCPLCVEQRWIHAWALIAGLGGSALLHTIRGLGPRAARDAARALQPVIAGSRLKRFWLALRAPAGIGRAACAILAAIFAWSFFVAGHHAGVEYGWWSYDCQAADIRTIDVGSLLADLSRAQNVVLCDEPAWTLLGISMAGYNALFSALFCVLSLIALFRNPSWRVL